MMGLTSMQAQCLDAIKRLSRSGSPPTFEMIGLELGVASKSTVHRLVHGLKERGAVAFEPGRRQSLRVVSAAADLSSLDDRTSDHLRAIRARCDEILKGRGH